MIGAQKVFRFALFIQLALTLASCGRIGFELLELEEPGETDSEIPDSPVTVGTINTLKGYSWGKRKLGFHALGRHWLFLADTDIRFTSSSDAVTWQSPEIAVAGTHADFYQVSVVAEGGFVHMVYAEYFGANFEFWVDCLGEPAYYRRGALGADGSIVWEKKTAVAVPADPSRCWICLAIAVDTQGRPAVFYHEAGTAGLYGCWATGSSAIDGTWNTETGLPASLESSWLKWFGIPLSLGGDDMYYFYCDGLLRCFGRTYSAGVLGAQQAVFSVNPDSMSAVAFGDEVNVVGCDPENRLVHHQRRQGSWRGLDDIAADTSINPVLAVVDDASGKLGVAWPAGNRILYRMGVRQADDTYVWDSAARECYDAASGGEPRAGPIEVYGADTDSRLWVVFMTGTEDPYSVHVVPCGP